MSTVTFSYFNQSQFASGEYDVQINQRIYHDGSIQLEWNWFNSAERDIFALLLKIDAIKRNYPTVTKIELYAPYLPYLRQDRLFNAGQSVPAAVLINTLKQAGITKIITAAAHTTLDMMDFVLNKKHVLSKKDESFGLFHKDSVFVLPDINAQNHYTTELSYGVLVGSKIRDDTGAPKLNLEVALFTKIELESPATFYILDDIVAGGRTFIECATAIKAKYGDLVGDIELIVYHAFLDYGITELQKSGVSKIHIINQHSYDYIMLMYPSDQSYFNYLPICPC